MPPPPYPNPLEHIIEVLDLAIRADLDSVRYEYFICLLICTAVVFAGLVCEVGEVWHDVIGFFKKRQFEEEYEATPELIRRERIPSHRVKMWAAVGWLLIVVGVGGEGVSDGLLSWADSTLQTFNNILLEATQKEAAFALERAAESLKEAAQLRQDTALIEESLAGRRLSPKNSAILRDRMTKFQGQAVIPWYVVGDSEAGMFAWDIAKALHAAKLEVSSPHSQMGMAPTGKPFDATLANFPTGVQISCTESSRAAAKTLVSALNNLGFDAELNPVNEVLHAKYRLAVWVAPRPIGLQGAAKLKLEAAKKKMAQSSPNSQLTR